MIDRSDKIKEFMRMKKMIPEEKAAFISTQTQMMMAERDDLENPPGYTQLRDDYWAALGESLACEKRTTPLSSELTEGIALTRAIRGYPTPNAKRLR